MKITIDLYGYMCDEYENIITLQHNRTYNYTALCVNDSTVYIIHFIIANCTVWPHLKWHSFKDCINTLTSSKATCIFLTKLGQLTKKSSNSLGKSQALIKN